MQKSHANAKFPTKFGSFLRRHGWKRGKQSMADDITDGDNFKVVGTWQIETGSGWRVWQREALLACQRAARANGDEFTAHALDRRIRFLEFSNLQECVQYISQE